MNAKGEMQLLWLTAIDCNHLKKQKHAGGMLNMYVCSPQHNVYCTGLDKGKTSR